MREVRRRVRRGLVTKLLRAGETPTDCQCAYPSVKSRMLASPQRLQNLPSHASNSSYFSYVCVCVCGRGRARARGGMEVDEMRRGWSQPKPKGKAPRTYRLGPPVKARNKALQQGSDVFGDAVMGKWLPPEQEAGSRMRR